MYIVAILKCLKKKSIYSIEGICITDLQIRTIHKENRWAGNEWRSIFVNYASISPFLLHRNDSEHHRRHKLYR